VEKAEMTIRIPPENTLDKILRLLGRERRILIPTAAVRMYNELGPYVQILGRRESFFSALFRVRRYLDDLDRPESAPQESNC
jgi:hypothetical protein